MGDVVNMPEDDSGSNSRSSPDAKCPICLDKLKNKASSDSCFHFFCFDCLHKWAKVKPECPLCKQRFTLLYFNFKDSGVFDRMEVPPPSPSESNQFHHNFNVVLNMFGRQYGRLFIDPMTFTPEFHYPLGRTRQGHQVSFRRHIYMRNLYINGFDGPPRPSNAHYCFASQFDRLRPWLVRELAAIGSTGADSTAMVSRLLMAIERHAITSRYFRYLVSQIVESRFVTHFIHEFQTFATSTYNISGFDAHARYPLFPPPIEHDSDIEVIYESLASRSSDTTVTRRSTSASISSDIVISDDESGIEVIEVERRESVRNTTDVLVISSEEELPSTSVPHRSRRNNQSTGGSGTPGPSSSASRPDIPSTTRKSKWKHRKIFKRISIASDTSSNDETDFAERIPRGCSSHRKSRTNGLENCELRNEGSESNVVRRNPVHFRKKRKMKRLSRPDILTDSAPLPPLLKRLRKRLRSFVVVPSTATATISDTV